MVISSIIKHLFSDKDSLADYHKGIVPEYNDIRRRLLLLARTEDRNIPDHYYRLNLEKSFKGIESLGELIRIGLYRLAGEYLELKEHRIYVKQLKQNNWQELITYIPPLVLQMAFLHIKQPLVDKSSKGIIEYFNEYILPNTKYTALPYPYIPQIENYIKEKQGFHDLHMHLNGSTEVDIAWQDFLMNPDKVYSELEKGLKTPLAKEQFEQESYLRSPIEFRDLLLCARSIRTYLFEMLFPDPMKRDALQKINSIKEVFSYLLDSVSSISNETNPFVEASVYNPFSELVYADYKNAKYPMAVEGLMYVLIFNYIAENTRESAASVLHFYLLILGLSNRLLVQQTHQLGFEQFQKITLNELRENSEKSYSNRFFQLHGNDQRNILFLEGRFAPKLTETANRILISSIKKGWEDLLANVRTELQLSNVESPSLKLIAHFIKKKEDDGSKEIRHKNLRYEIWSKAKVLALLRERDPILMEDFVGIDAASSEFDTPPEVFAPSFRLLRRKGVKHFTYHAGEDFFHVISGLRAIYEAVTFNELSCGDRVGHATAAGVSPEIWICNVGDKLFIRQGEYLDNLLFVYHLVISRKNKKLKATLPALTNKIQELSFLIYEKSYSLEVMESAWLIRRFCPSLLFSDSKENARILDTFDDCEWEDIKKEVTDSQYDERVQLLERYHSKKCRDEYNKIIEIATEEFYSAADLELLQLLILEFLHEKEIVIETLPTSNVRIGHHSNFDTYHLWNWLRWEKKGKAIPPIVVGTDDAGIFATNIYNEYANIYCNLVTFNKVSHNEAMRFIENLDKNGRIYKFT